MKRSLCPSKFSEQHRLVEVMTLDDTLTQAIEPAWQVLRLSKMILYIPGDIMCSTTILNTLLIIKGALYGKHLCHLCHDKGIQGNCSSILYFTRFAILYLYRINSTVFTYYKDQFTKSNTSPRLFSFALHAHTIQAPVKPNTQGWWCHVICELSWFFHEFTHEVGVTRCSGEVSAIADNLKEAGEGGLSVASTTAL